MQQLRKRGGGGHLGDYLNWLEASSGSTATLRLRSNQLGRLGREYDLQFVTHDEILAYMNRQTWKPATTASFWATCKSYFEWAKERGLRSDNPMDGVRPVKVPPSPPKIASAQALQEAIEKASRRDRLALMLAAYAGLRRAEVAGLHASMIEDGWIRVEGKGKKVRRVPIHPDLAGELKRARDMGGYLFPGRDGDGPISPDSMGKRMGRLLPPGVSAHHLRHMFATSAYRHSHDIRAVQQLLGHSSLATTQIYVSSNDDELMAAVFGIGAA